MRSLRRDLHQQPARLEEFRSIYAKLELEGNVPGAADTLHDLILETQAHIDKAKLREEEAVSDVLKHMKDPSTKLFFANRVGPAQVSQMIRELTGRKPIPGLASLMTGDPALEWKRKKKSTLKTLLRDDGKKIPFTCGPSSVILANRAHESLNSATPMDELQETQRLSEITESSRKEVVGEAPIGQIQAAPEREEEKGNEHELKDNPPADQGTDIPSNLFEVGEISKFGLEVSSTPSSPGLGDCEALKENPAGKTKSRSIWRKVKISKIFESR